MKQLTVIAFVITALEGAATVYPIDPMPLRKLIMETELHHHRSRGFN